MNAPRPSSDFDVRTLRRRLGMNQSQFADEVGTTERTIRRWEREGHGIPGPAVKVLKQMQADLTEKRASGGQSSSLLQRRRLESDPSDDSAPPVGIL